MSDQPVIGNSGTMVIVFGETLTASELDPRINNIIVTMTTTPSINPATQAITITMCIRNFFCCLKAYVNFFPGQGLRLCYSDVKNF